MPKKRNKIVGEWTFAKIRRFCASDSLINILIDNLEINHRATISPKIICDSIEEWHRGYHAKKTNKNK